MNAVLEDVRAALIPLPALGVLGPLRAQEGILVTPLGERAWIEWTDAKVDVLSWLLPVAGAEFFVPQPEAWYRLGSRLPTSDVPPEGEAQPLDRALLPVPFIAEAPAAAKQSPVVLRLVPSSRPQMTSACQCDLASLATWMDTVSSFRLASLRAARLGTRAILRGTRLPPLAGARRFWGDSVLLPLRRRLEPDLPASAVREALGISADDILFWTEDGPEAIASSCFQPLSRASIRLALDEKE